jgi:hypothetical protein
MNNFLYTFLYVNQSLWGGSAQPLGFIFIHVSEQMDLTVFFLSTQDNLIMVKHCFPDNFAFFGKNIRRQTH